MCNVQTYDDFLHVRTYSIIGIHIKCTVLGTKPSSPEIYIKQLREMIVQPHQTKNRGRMTIWNFAVLHYIWLRHQTNENNAFGDYMYNLWFISIQTITNHHITAISKYMTQIYYTNVYSIRKKHTHLIIWSMKYIAIAVATKLLGYLSNIGTMR